MAEHAAVLRTLSQTAGNRAVAGLVMRSKTKRRPARKGPAVVEIATVKVLPGDTSTTLMIRALLQAYGARGMTDREASAYALKALANHPAPGQRVRWKPGREIPVSINARSKRFLDRKYGLGGWGEESEDTGGPTMADGGEGGETMDASGAGEGVGDAKKDLEGGGSVHGSKGGTGAPGDEGVVDGGVTREEGGAAGGRVGAEDGGAEGGRRRGEGKEGDRGVRGALGWFPLIKISEYWAPLVEVALILADAGAFDGAFKKLMKVAARAIRSELKQEARRFAKGGAQRLARLLKEGRVPAHEAAYIKKLAVVQDRARFYKELAERAAAEHRKYAKWVEEGAPNQATLKHLRAQRDQAARIEREARALHLQEIDDANKLRGRDVTTGDPGLDAQIDEAIGGAESPAVKGRSRPTVDGHRVPTTRGDRVDIDDLRLRPGESPRDALARIRRVIGRRISDTPLAKAWNEARRQVLDGRAITQLGKDRINKEIYPKVRDRFWQLVRDDSEARTYLVRAGFDLGDSPAPLLRVNREVPVQQIRVSLDHAAEKAIGKNWKKALDADNLVFEFQDPNAFREIVQRRHKMRDRTPTPR